MEEETGALLVVVLWALTSSRDPFGEPFMLIYLLLLYIRQCKLKVTTKYYKAFHS